MKNIYFLTIFLVVFCFSSLSQNITSLKTVPLSYCSSNEPPKLFKLGDTIFISCDTVYLINKIRYKFYKDIHSAMLQDDNGEYTGLLKAYENRLNEHSLAYNKLLQNSKDSEKTSLALIDYTQKSLQNTQRSLDYSQQALEQSIKNLEQANALIKREKWNSRGQKALVGIGGVSIGVLIGVLVMK